MTEKNSLGLGNIIYGVKKDDTCIKKFRVSIILEILDESQNTHTYFSGDYYPKMDNLFEINEVYTEVEKAIEQVRYNLEQKEKNEQTN